jgi:hypothetical protein
LLLASQYCRHGKEAQPPKPIVWSIYKIAAKAVRLGTIEAPDEAAAMEKACGGIRGEGRQPADGDPALWPTWA